MASMRVTTRRPGNVLKTVLVLTSLVGASWSGGSAVAQTSSLAAQGSDAAPLDLAAMVLRSSDLEAEGLEGFGDVRIGRGKSWQYLPTGFMVLPEAIDQSVVAGPDLDLSRLYLELGATGWQRQFRGVLGRYEAEIDGVDPLVISTVGEYADADGAAAAFKLLTTTDDIDGVVDLKAQRIGDESAVYRDTTNLLFLEDERRTLTFRLDRLVATVQVDGGGVRYEQAFEPATLEALGRRLAARVEEVRASDSGGLAPLVLHLDVPISPFIERYDLLDRDLLPFWNETKDQVAARAAGYEGRTDIYRLDQAVPIADRGLSQVPRYSVTLSRFEDEATASAWLAGVPERRQLVPLAGAAQFGDESLTFAEEYEWEGVTRRGFRIYVRVGVFVAAPILDGGAESPLEAVEALASIQTQCLEAGACSGPTPIPGEILAQVCPAGTAAQAAAAGPEITGEVPMAGSDPARTGRQPGPGPDGAPDVRWRFDALGKVQAGPVVAGGTVYVGSGVDNVLDGTDGNLYALDAATGDLRWCVPTGGFFTGAQAVVEGLVVGGHNDQRVRLGRGGAVVALDAATGEERWRVFTGSHLRDATVVDGTVYVGEGDGSFLALDLQTGEVRWRLQPSQDPDATFRVGLAVAGDLVYAGFRDDRDTFLAMDARTGEERWRFEDLDPAVDLLGGPTVAEGRVFLTTTTGDGGLYALDAADGQTSWRFEPAFADAKASGPEGTVALQDPAVADGVVYAGGALGDAGFLFAIDAETGTELWRLPIGQAVRAQPAVVDGVVYVVDASGVLHAVGAATGEELWQVPAGSEGSLAPAVLGGVVFVTSEKGIVALGS